MTDKIPLYVIGLEKNKPIRQMIHAKFGATLEKVQFVLPKIIEAKVSIKSQNTDGERTHYDAIATVVNAKRQLVFTESGWDILKIVNELCRKLEGELSKPDNNKRQRDTIRKKEY